MPKMDLKNPAVQKLALSLIMSAGVLGVFFFSHLVPFSFQNQRDRVLQGPGQHARLEFRHLLPVVNGDTIFADEVHAADLAVQIQVADSGGPKQKILIAMQIGALDDRQARIGMR